VVDNRLIVAVDRATGAETARFEGPRDGPIIHMNSLSLHEGRIYAAHSNYPRSRCSLPWKSSRRHRCATSAPTPSASCRAASPSWEWHGGAWWAVWANYSRVFGQSQRPYGNTWWTHLTRHDTELRQTGGWTFPPDILRRAEPMSISGASWGPGGLLWCTGHDHTEVYALRLPAMGSVLQRVHTLPIEAEGQAIAWEKGGDGNVLWQIIRSRTEVVAQRLSGL
jgi:hypothetical protein